MTCTKLLELAAAHALGALSPADAALLEAALAQDPEARAELATFHDTAALITAGLATPARPSAGLRAKILERAAQARPATTTADSSSPESGFQFVPNEAANWVADAIPGIRRKILSVSRDMGYLVALTELAPGARFPEHDHHSSEELFIVSGHLHTEGRVLGPGDFLHAEPGTHHHELLSPDGCVALIIKRAPPAALAAR